MFSQASLHGSAYLEQMRKWAERDEARLSLMRNAGSGGQVFTNVEFPLRVNYALFETKAATSVPTRHYQVLKVDDEALRNDWAPDFCRSIAFLKDGLLLVSKGVASSGANTLLFYHAVKFDHSEYSFTDLGAGKFEVAVRNVTKHGKDLLRDSEVSHKFDFSFKHHPTETAKMSFESFRARSGVVSNIYDRHGGMLRESKGNIIMVPHFEPHPYLLTDYARFGYKSKDEFVDSMSELLRSYLVKRKE